MKALILLVFVCLGAAWAQAPASPALPNLPDSEVIAVLADGTQFTMGDFRRAFAAIPVENQPMALRSRKMFVEQWALMRKLAAMAEQAKLDQESPARDQLAYYRMMILSQAELNQALNNISIPGADIATYYAANRDAYKQVKVKAIYITFGEATPEGKKALSEEEAKAKAEDLLRQIRSGADFVKLVKENSDDETSRERDGDFATLNPKDKIPDAIRAAVFTLNKGEVAGPIRQPNGFYLLRAEDVTYRPLEKVRDEIFTELRQQRYAQWLDAQHKAAKVEFPNAAFTGEAGAAPPPAK